MRKPSHPVVSRASRVTYDQHSICVFGGSAAGRLQCKTREAQLKIDATEEGRCGVVGGLASALIEHRAADLSDGRRSVAGREPGCRRRGIMRRRRAAGCFRRCAARVALPYDVTGTCYRPQLVSSLSKYEETDTGSDF